MKIGILTQPIHWNYGGVLQCWALQKVLCSMGHEPVKLERRGKNPWPLVGRLPLSIAKTALWKLFGYRRDLSLRHIVEETINKASTISTRRLGMAVSRPLYTTKSLSMASREMDAFIVGSDQVWREEYSPAIEDFFFEYLDATDSRPRIAYAASFGKFIDPLSAEKLPHCREALRRFTAISVRENDGCEILRRDFGITDVPVVLDPTLLLTADDYRHIIKRVDNNPHITAYIIDNTPEKDKIIDSVAVEFNQTVDRLCVRTEYGAKGRSPIIQEWLQSIADSEFVITDSFHGTVFAILFSKPFITIANSVRGLGRFQSLLRPLGLEQNLMADFDSYKVNQNIIRRPIDYNKVHAALDIKRRMSVEFLYNSLR